MVRLKHLVFFLLVCQVALAQENNVLTTKETKDGWALLFDGKSTKGWHNYNKGSLGAGWKAEMGELFLDPAIEGGGGYIISDIEYENFDLMLEWKLDSCGNSGIIFNAIESPDYKEAWNTGPEVQIISRCHSDGMNNKHKVSDLFDLISSAEESTKPVTEWNAVRIVSNAGHLEVWLNGRKQIETTMFTPEWRALIAGSKFKRYPDFATAKKGHLVLQDHGDKVAFRNIKIREL